MIDIEYRRTKSGIQRNKHFEAGTVNGAGIVTLVVGFISGTSMLMVVGFTLTLAGLFYEAFITDKAVKAKSIKNQENLLRK